MTEEIYSIRKTECWKCQKHKRLYELLINGANEEGGFFCKICIEGLKRGLKDE